MFSYRDGFSKPGVFLLPADCPEALQLLDAWLLAAAEVPKKRPSAGNTSEVVQKQDEETVV